MEKKSIFIIILAILLVIIGFMAFTSLGSSQVTIGDTIIKLPSGFHEGTPNSAGDVNITNGYDSVFIKQYNHKNITKCLNDYKKYKKENNQTVKITNSKINKTTVYKSTVQNESTIHYWFVYRNKVYTIYTWGGNENIDGIATDIIKSNI